MKPNYLLCASRERSKFTSLLDFHVTPYIWPKGRNPVTVFFLLLFSCNQHYFFRKFPPPLKHVAGKDGEVFAISQICARFTTINRISPTSIQIQVRRSSGGDFLTCCGYSIYGHSLASALLLFFPTNAIVKKSIPYNFTILLTCLGDNI